MNMRMKCIMTAFAITCAGLAAFCGTNAAANASAPAADEMRRPDVRERADKIVEGFLKEFFSTYEVSTCDGGGKMFDVSISPSFGNSSGVRLSKVFKTFNCRFLVENDGLVKYYCFLPCSAGERTKEVADFLSRANTGLIYGSFELGFDDGGMRYRTVWPECLFRGPRGKERFVEFVTSPLTMVCKWVDGCALVALGAKTPEEAAKTCEGDD